MANSNSGFGVARMGSRMSPGQSLGASAAPESVGGINPLMYAMSADQSIEPPSHFSGPFSGLAEWRTHLNQKEGIQQQQQATSGHVQSFKADFDSELQRNGGNRRAALLSTMQSDPTRWANLPEQFHKSIGELLQQGAPMKVTKGEALVHQGDDGKMVEDYKNRVDPPSMKAVKIGGKNFAAAIDNETGAVTLHPTDDKFTAVQTKDGSLYSFDPRSGTFVMKHQGEKDIDPYKGPLGDTLHNIQKADAAGDKPNGDLFRRQLSDQMAKMEAEKTANPKAWTTADARVFDGGKQMLNLFERMKPNLEATGPILGGAKHVGALLGSDNSASALEGQRLEAERIASNFSDTKLKSALETARAAIPGSMSSESLHRKEVFPNAQLGIRQQLADEITKLQASGKQVPAEELATAKQYRYDPDSMRALQTARDHIGAGSMEPGDFGAIAPEIAYDKTDKSKYTGQIPHSEYVSALKQARGLGLGEPGDWDTLFTQHPELRDAVGSQAAPAPGAIGASP